MTFWERNQLKLAPFLFLAPAVGLFLIFVIYPIADSIWVSFHEWSGVNRYAVDDEGNLKNFKWVGLDNYIYLFTNDDEFYALYSKFSELIEDTEYNIDIVDLYTMLHNAMEDFEMYE